MVHPVIHLAKPAVDEKTNGDGQKAAMNLLLPICVLHATYCTSKPSNLIKTLFSTMLL